MLARAAGQTFQRWQECRKFRSTAGTSAGSAVSPQKGDAFGACRQYADARRADTEQREDIEREMDGPRESAASFAEKLGANIARSFLSDGNWIQQHARIQSKTGARPAGARAHPENQHMQV